MHGTEMLTQLSLNNSIIKTIKLEEGIFFVTKILIRKKCSVNTCVLCNKKPNNHSIVADRWKKMWRTSRCWRTLVNIYQWKVPIKASLSSIENSCGLEMKQLWLVWEQSRLEMAQLVHITTLFLLIILWASPGCRGQRGESQVSLIVL